jgi:hypothetical protein
VDVPGLTLDALRERGCSPLESDVLDPDIQQRLSEPSRGSGGTLPPA